MDHLLLSVLISNHSMNNPPVGQVMSPLSVAVGVAVADATCATEATMPMLATRPERARRKVAFMVSERIGLDDGRCVSKSWKSEICRGVYLGIERCGRVC
jgi:hypothetical protein